ncbi:hypothetical protein LTR50_005840 [Elasticomyces elasticus]|nr:hypothetical protein LTR50_005840 [Elasticomyces elasticus]
MATPRTFKTDFSQETDMDSLFDFSQGTGTTLSPATTTSTPRYHPMARTDSRPASTLFDIPEDRPVHFDGPSHEYERFKQQTGVPVNLQPMHHVFQQTFDGFNSGMDGGYNSGIDFGFNSGFDMDSDMGMGMDFNASQTMPAMFFPSTGPLDMGQDTDDLIDPLAIGGEEPANNVQRLWPGIHQQRAQQAAMAKVQQQQAMQQRLPQPVQQQQQTPMQQQKRTSQSHQQQPQQTPSKPSAFGHQNDPHTEESISRLLSQMRQNSTVSSIEDANSPGAGGNMSHISRMRKEEEDMDEDERLLASDEGKKLSSKERRQLRNKVSARAFRSRRKGTTCPPHKHTPYLEYIGQLESEIAMKSQECQGLRTENGSLRDENARYRGLIETLLRHPAFTPFIEDLSHHPTVTAPPPRVQSQQSQSQPQSQQQQQQDQMSMTPTPVQQEAKPYPDFDASQMQIPSQQSQVGMAILPETPVDLSMLNLGNRSFNHTNFNFQQPQVYSVLELPEGPSPLELRLDLMSGKTDAVEDDVEELEEAAEVPQQLKLDYPVGSFAPAAAIAAVSAPVSDKDDARYVPAATAPLSVVTAAASDVALEECLLGISSRMRASVRRIRRIAGLGDI